MTTDQADVAASRIRFLTEHSSETETVRGPILASWQRSVDLQVSADKIEMSYRDDPGQEAPLSRSAEPVLRTLREQLDGQSVSIILTDHAGLVLSRMTGDADLERYLEGVRLAPGFSYAERFVGTNGIGTALEVGGPAYVFGHEHFAEDLDQLACAGVPIHHPISGRVVGAVDLTCWRRDAGSLLLALAKTTAAQIQQVLLSDSSERERALFQEYLRTCVHHPGVVFAISSDLVMLNSYARSVVSPEDQAALVAHAAESAALRQPTPSVVELPSGLGAKLYLRPVRAGTQAAGVVAHVRLDREEFRLPASPPRGTIGAGRTATAWTSLPGLVGNGPSWLHACQEVERLFLDGEWLALEGEPGVGKLALLRAVQLRRRPVGRVVVLDPAEHDTDASWSTAVHESLMRADSLIVRRADSLAGPRVRILGAALHDSRAGERTPWVGITLRPGEPAAHVDDLLRLFPRTVPVPPLRLHLEDLQPLLTHFLSRLTQGGRLTCSPVTMRLLMRMGWPGNIAQLHQLLREVVKHRRGGVIEPHDLPPEAHAMSRRVLSHLESIERDAVVRSLADSGGNKVQAAKALGMSRATIYRKIHDYGIIAPNG